MKLKKLLHILIISLAVFLSACMPKTPEQIAKERRKNIDTTVARAQTMMFEEKNQDAIDLLNASFNQYGDDVKLCELLAQAYAQVNQYDLAAMFYEKSASLPDGNPALYLNAANAYEQLKAYEQAMAMYEKYLKAIPSDFLAWKSLAKIYTQQQKYNEALTAYMSSLKVASRNPTTDEACDIGLLFLKIGNIPQALKWLESALEATSEENLDTRKNILIGLMDLYLAEKNMPKLEAIVQELNKMDDKLVESLHPGLNAQIADFRAKLEAAKLALEQEKLAKEEAEKKAKLEAEKAEAEKLALEEKMKAIEAEKIKTTQEKSKQETTAQAPAENLPAEIKDVEKPKEDDSESLMEKSRKSLEDSDTKAAEKFAHKAVMKDPVDYMTWRTLAKAYEAQERWQDACLAAKESMLRNPDNLDANLMYLRQAAKVLPYDKMLDALYASLKKFPSNSEIMLGIARTYRLSGNKNNAMFFYKKFLDETSSDHPNYAEASEEYAQLTTR